MVTDLAKRFVSQILVGYNLNDGPEELMASFEKYYHGHAKKALETATKMVFNKYQDFLAEQKS